MGAFCCHNSVFAQLSRAAAKSVGARLRSLGAMSTAPAWQARAELCERCPMRVIRDGVSFCGTPYLQKLARDPALDGCGCPTKSKAKDPTEHCPVTPDYDPAARSHHSCNCKWCAASASQSPSAGRVASAAL